MKKIKLFKFTNFKKMFELFFIIFIILLLFIVYNYYNFFSKKNVISRVSKSVVLVEIYDESNNLISTGSGFCTYNNYTFVTNYHVIEGSYKIVLKTNSSEEIAVKEIVGFSEVYDLAILETEKTDLKPLKIKKAGYSVGDDIIAIGSPLGIKNTVSTGIISAIDIDNNGEIQISAPISHGSSGGALFDNRGNVIGITYAGIEEGQNLNFAISVKIMNDMYNSLNDNGSMTSATINKDNYLTCIPEIEGINSFNYLSIQELDFSGCLDYPDIYKVTSIDLFYKLTNDRAIFEEQTKNSLGNLYSIQTEKNKQKIIEQYNFLQSYDSMWCFGLVLGTDNRDRTMCEDRKNLSDWTTDEFIINEQVLTRSMLAIYNVVTDGKNNKEIDSYINSLPISAAKKITLLLLNGHSPRDFNNEQNKTFIDFVYSSSDNGVDASNNNITNDEIIKLFGYTVKNGKIYW